MNARFLGSKAIKTYDLLIRLVTPKLKDPLSKAEEPEQPFRLASPIIPIATQSPEGGVKIQSSFSARITMLKEAFMARIWGGMVSHRS